MRTTIQFRERGFDDWKAEDPDPRCGENAEPVTRAEQCEHCARWVAATSVAYCHGCRRFSYWPSRPERRGGR